MNPEEAKPCRRDGRPPAGPPESNGQGQVEESQTRLDRLRSKLLTCEQLDSLPPPEPLIEGVLMKGTLAVLFSRPGLARSFLGVDWALSVATGSW